DVQPPALGLDPGVVDALGGLTVGVLVAGPAADALIAAGAEGPAAVLGARTVAGEQDGSHIRAAPGVVEDPVELVDGVRSEGVAHLGPVEGDPDDAVDPARAGVAVVSDVGEVLEALDGAPLIRVERCGRGHGSTLN